MPKANTKKKVVDTTETVETINTDVNSLNQVSDPETNTTTTNTTEQKPLTGEIIDIEWVDIRPLFTLRERLEDLQKYFADTCLQFEKTKANMMSQIMYGENDVYTMAQNLRKSKNIDESLTYELKLPTQSGEKGYFVRKDNNDQ